MEWGGGGGWWGNTRLEFLMNWVDRNLHPNLQLIIPLWKFYSKYICNTFLVATFLKTIRKLFHKQCTNNVFVLIKTLIKTITWMNMLLTLLAEHLSTFENLTWILAKALRTFPVSWNHLCDWIAKGFKKLKEWNKITNTQGTGAWHEALLEL